jgi:glycosyltransferase involved in cell wall biosynthesis
MNKSASQGDKLRVALVISDLGLGGAERQVVELAKGLGRDRFEVFVVTLTDHVPLLAEDREVERKHYVVKKRWKYDMTVVWRIARLFESLKVDVAHAFMFDAEIATALSRLVRRTSVVVLSERNADYEVSAVHRLGRKVAMALSDHCVANSSAGARFHASVIRQPDSKYSVVHNSVDSEKFVPRNLAECRIEVGLPADKFIIGVFASFKPQKNHGLVLKALRKLDDQLRQDVLVLFVGDTLAVDHKGTNDYKREILRLIEELNLSSTILLLGARTDLPLVYPACDVTLLPSRHEGLPNVMLESLACGIPVIVTDVSDNARIVGGLKHCVVLREPDADELAGVFKQKMTQDRLSTDDRDYLREAILKGHSREQMASNMASVYENLVRGSRVADSKQDSH